MAKNQSAGILLYRSTHTAPAGQTVPADDGAQAAGLEVFLVHPGGPFWKKKDAGSWTIPKGEFGGDEKALDAAIREFGEETGYSPASPFIPLNPVRQKGGKLVYAWAAAGDLDPSSIVSNEFELEWPPRSGRMQSFPEVDKGGWFTVAAAREKINPAQMPLLEALSRIAGTVT
ncbi:MAG TPA: NUDIX domain-containing protein [Puia sp.]|nr:NUDIX domain-containing protein [Puia sp.]